jgi:hypothetical protein
VILFDLGRRKKGQSEMPRKGCKAEVLLGQGKDVDEVRRKIKVTRIT